MSFEELVVGDLIRFGNLSLSEVYGGGYFEMHQLWWVLDEVRAKELFELTRAFENVHYPEGRRDEFFEWLDERQPRMASARKQQQLSDELKDRLQKLFS